MSIERLSRVTSLSNGDSLPISSSGLGGDAQVTLSVLTEHIASQVEVGSGVPNDGSVTVDKLADDTVALIDDKIAAAVDGIEPVPGSAVTPTAFSPVIDFRSNKSMPITGFYLPPGDIEFAVDETGAVPENETTAKVRMSTSTTVTAPGFTLADPIPTGAGDVLFDFVWSGGIPFLFAKVLGASAPAPGGTVLPNLAPPLAKWQAAKGRGASNPARLLVFGDSNVAGEGGGSGTYGLTDARKNGFGVKLATAASMNSESFFGDQNVTIVTDVHTFDPRVTLGAGWAADTEPSTVGGRFITGTSPSGAVTFAPALAFDEMTLWYPAVSGLGTLTVSIDGTVKTPTVTQDDATAEYLKYVFTAALGTHTISISGTGSAFISGITTRNSANSTPLVLVDGWCGALVNDLMTNARNYANNPWGAKYAPTALAADLTIVYATINDVSANTSLSTYQSTVSSWVTSQASATNGVLVVGFPSNHDGTTNGLLDSYATALRSIANSNGWGFFDSRSVFGVSWAEANAKGYAFDNDHPNAAGHLALAAALNTYLVAAGLNTSTGTPVPVNSVAPAISGTAQVGQTLTVSNGTWSNTPTSYAYQWKRAGTSISGATAQTYVPVTADVGNTLTCAVTASNAGGAGTAATSAATAAVIAAASSGFTDDFNRSASNTTVGNGWTTDANSTWGINGSGQAYVVSASDNDSTLTRDVGATNGTVAADIRLPDTLLTGFFGVGPIIRYIDATHMTWVVLNADGVFVLTRNGGGASVATSYTPALTAGTIYRVSAALTNAGYTISLNGTALGAAVADTVNNASTKAGLHGYLSTPTAAFDNFSYAP